ncbi:alpha/beta hydrolase [Mucilaginibacter arboris]|uniref:Alpha/beta fold hydrolase n=1 Tax=Mucilaginibacter arboris TaxID=2682090 RepID=A0A7K1T0B2_9SPHI|nr:alpha/beta hydrolase [Mucilaginibacter arboris]MVN22999.1 alpha/beta fold hydrolase [Mucilaginibacter arboris]
MNSTIVFIHGMFQNPKSWAKWITYFEAKEYNCLAPAWPLHEGEPADLRANPPAGLGDLELNDIIVKIEEMILKLDDKPIVVGHSVGGLIVQLLVNRKMVKAGVAIDSVAPNAMLDFDWGFFKNSAAIANPFKGNEPFEMDGQTFQETFCNTMDPEETKLAYQEFATHDSRNVLRDCMGEAGQLDVELAHAPLLLIAGEKDQIIPASLTEKNAKAYTDEGSITSFKEFPNRGHYICGEPGWEEVAAYAYNWLEDNKTAFQEEQKGFFK